MSKLQMFIDAVQDVAPQIWEIYVRQVQVEGWTSIAISGLTLVSILVGSGLWLRAIYSKPKSTSDIGDRAAGTVMILLFVSVGVGMLIYHPDVGIRSGILKVANPQYEAVSMIMKEARKN